MHYMFIFLCLTVFTFASQSSEPLSTSLERTIEYGDNIFKDSGKILYPRNFDQKKFDSLIQKIGYVYPPFSTVDHTKLVNSKLMFQVKYNLSDYGQRITPQNKKSASSFHFILAGDSNVFGEGCNEEDTVTAQLSALMNNFHLYNFGHRGGGPHNTLSLWEHYPVQNLVSEKKGLFLYDLFASHMLERVIGSKNYVAWDNGLSPWYELDDHDQAVFKGQFKDKQITSLYSFISHSRWLNWLFPVLPQINEAHIHLIAKIFVKMKQLYLTSFPEGRFFVLLNNSAMDDRDVERLKSELKKYKIETISIPHKQINIEPFTYKDMHFNPEGQKWQARLISEAVLKIFPLH